MKFKVGDYVKIKEGLNRENTDDFVKEMEEYCGKVAKIIGINRTSYKLDIDKREWFWSDDMLEPAQKEYRVIICGNTAIVKDDKGNECKANIDAKISHAIENMRRKPSLGEEYYTIRLSHENLVGQSAWQDDSIDNNLYNKNLVFKTKEEAEEAVKTMLDSISRRKFS